MVVDEFEAVATPLLDCEALSSTPSYKQLIGTHVQCGREYSAPTPGSTVGGSDKNVYLFGFDPPPARIQV